MIAKTVIPAKMRFQSDNRAELQAMIDAAKGFVLVDKIYKISGVFYANMIEQDYALPIYNDGKEDDDEGAGGEGGQGSNTPTDPTEGGEGGNTPSTPTDPTEGGNDQQGGGDQQETPVTLTAEEAAAYNTAKGLTEGQEGYVKEGDPKPADFDEVVNQ